MEYRYLLETRPPPTEFRIPLKLAKTGILRFPNWHRAVSLWESANRAARDGLPNKTELSKTADILRIAFHIHRQDCISSLAHEIESYWNWQTTDHDPWPNFVKHHRNPKSIEHLLPLPKENHRLAFSMLGTGRHSRSFVSETCGMSVRTLNRLMNDAIGQLRPFLLLCDPLSDFSHRRLSSILFPSNSNSGPVESSPLAGVSFGKGGLGDWTSTIEEVGAGAMLGQIAWPLQGEGFPVLRHRLIWIRHRGMDPIGTEIHHLQEDEHPFNLRALPDALHRQLHRRK